MIAGKKHAAVEDSDSSGKDQTYEYDEHNEADEIATQISEVSSYDRDSATQAEYEKVKAAAEIDKEVSA